MADINIQGDYDFNLTKLGEITNNSMEIGAKTTEGVADMAAIVGIGIAISLVGTLLAIGIIAILSIAFVIISKVSGFRKATRR